MRLDEKREINTFPLMRKAKKRLQEAKTRIDDALQAVHYDRREIALNRIVESLIMSDSALNIAVNDIIQRLSHDEHKKSKSFKTLRSARSTTEQAA